MLNNEPLVIILSSEHPEIKEGTVFRFRDANLFFERHGKKYADEMKERLVKEPNSFLPENLAVDYRIQHQKNNKVYGHDFCYSFGENKSGLLEQIKKDADYFLDDRITNFDALFGQNLKKIDKDWSFVKNELIPYLEKQVKQHEISKDRPSFEKPTIGKGKKEPNKQKNLTLER